MQEDNFSIETEYFSSSNDQGTESIPKYVKRDSLFVDVQVTTKYEEWVKSGRKIFSGYIVDLYAFEKSYETVRLK